MNITPTEGLIRRYIVNHDLRNGTRLPPESDLAAALRCDLPTLAKELEAAAEEGLIGRDWFVHLPISVRDQQALSFGRSAQLHGEHEHRRVLEAARRLPLVDDEDPITTELERQAHTALGLGEQEPFLVITRLRLLAKDDGVIHAGTIHRAFLDPKLLPSDFLERDFEHESLIALYNTCGYFVDRRKDTFVSRLAAPRERIAFKLDLIKPVLDMEQRSMATRASDGQSCLIEYLRAAYWNIPFDLER